MKETAERQGNFFRSVSKGKTFADLGAPEKSRTPNLQIRSLALYPIELRALNQKTLAIPVESLSTF